MKRRIPHENSDCYSDFSDVGRDDLLRKLPLGPGCGARGRVEEAWSWLDPLHIDCIAET